MFVVMGKATGELREWVIEVEIILVLSKGS